MAYKFPTYTAVPGVTVAEEGGTPQQPMPAEPAQPAPQPEAPAAPQQPTEGMPSGN